MDTYYKIKVILIETFYCMDILLLYTKLASLPGDLKKEVTDFIDFLSSKDKQKSKKTGQYLVVVKEWF